MTTKAATPAEAKERFGSTEQKKRGSNGRRWKRMPRKRFRFWRPDEGQSLVCSVLGREERDGRYGRRPCYSVRVEEPGEDSKGEFNAGDLLAINEVATLRDLENTVKGRVCQITLEGRDGKVLLFDVDVEE